jgi:hypothetical protein
MHTCGLSHLRWLTTCLFSVPFCPQMADRKGPSALAAPIFTATTTSQWKAAVDAALSGMLLSDLTQIICAYGRRPGHRFDAETAPRERVTVSADGLSFTIIAQAPEPHIAAFIVRSRHTLRHGAQRWSMRLPIGVFCFVGVCDLRTLPAPGRDDLAEMVYVGHWVGQSVISYSTMPGPRAAVNAKVPFRRLTNAYRSKSTVVQCTFDEEARTLRMEIAGEPEAGALIATQMPAGEFLCPVMLLNRSALKEAAVFTIESEDE